MNKDDKNINSNIGVSHDTVRNDKVGEDNRDLSIQKFADNKFMRKRGIMLTLSLFVFLACVFGIYKYVDDIRKSKEIEELALQESKKMIFYKLPEIVVNLDTNYSSKLRLLTIGISLQIKGQNNLSAVEKWLPKIVDIIATYLRELRPDDLRGSFAVYKLRGEFMMRINAIIAPSVIEDVLFENIEMR